MLGTLYLLPNLLHDEADHHLYLPAAIADVIAKLDGVICETEKPARKYLGRFKRASLPLMLLNEHTKEEELHDLLKPLLEGKTIGLLSDAGLPCIADPGSLLVARARRAGIRVEAISGPCSITLALMLSGFPGQRFSFHGYLPRESAARKQAIRQLEQKAQKEQSTEIFIEAPYRNQELFKDAIETIQPKTSFAVACDLTCPTEEVHVHTGKEWKAKQAPDLHKRPTIFLIH
jgi:16S rRNA (cytidine1402-2'-O)-methyltransferase